VKFGQPQDVRCVVPLVVWLFHFVEVDSGVSGCVVGSATDSLYHWCHRAIVTFGEPQDARRAVPQVVHVTSAVRRWLLLDHVVVIAGLPSRRWRTRSTSRCRCT
jgi:hypothetical protein